MDIWQLKQRQSLPLEAKVRLTESRIRDWYDHWDGDVYVAFSGGVDSTALLHIVRSLYPHVPAVFCDTGLEFPQIRDFVRTFDNVEWLRPAMPFTKVLTTYGYPLISKEQAGFICQYRHTNSDKLRNLRWEGRGDKRKNGKIAERYKYLVDAPFEISDKCCDVMKKNPARLYAKRTGRKGIVGVMTEDSSLRQSDYLKYGCNSFDAREPLSRPLSFWFKADVWEYIRSRELDYCNIYDMGYDRTGCIFCMFGVHLEKGTNRFQRLAVTHPQLHAYCMENLGMKRVLEHIGVPSE
jgi:3'-phosphoadenosine 5'-phosphosulfate sulfotransferase (PAPS reductase)/FAD synthetase